MDHSFQLLSLGFRPFFFAAATFAIVVMLTWIGLFYPDWPLPFYREFPVLWHAHEMLFGYACAVIAGFLLTAVRNWTGIATTNGWRLAALVCLWLSARILLLPGIDVPFSIAALCDIAFLTCLCVGVTLPILRTGKYRQLAVVSKLVLLLICNAVFYLALLLDDLQLAWWAIYSGMYLIVSLVLMLARRVLPSFIENGAGYPVTLRNSKQVDFALLVLFVAFAVNDVFFAISTLGQGLSAALCVLHAWRWFGWYTRGIWRKPLLWVLYCAYFNIIVGFALKSVEPMIALGPSLAVHAFNYGGIGLMTLGMMSRVALGHTGRDVHAPPAFVGYAFALLLAGAVFRVLAPLILPEMYIILIGLSQLLWIVAFAMFLAGYAPMLIRPRVDGKAG